MIAPPVESQLGNYGALECDGRSFAERISALPHAVRAQLRRLGFLILRPELLFDGRATALLRHLSRRQAIVPVALRVLTIGPQTFDALYRFKLERFGEDAELHRRIFAAGRSAAVLVAGNPTSGPPVSAELDRLKGPSLALESSPASLRERFGRQSSFHAVLHASDSIGALVYEGTQFFTWPELQRILSAMAEAETLESIRLRDDLAWSLLSPEPLPESTVFQAACAVKEKMLTALALDEVDRPEVQVLYRLTTEARRQLASGSLHDHRGWYAGFVRRERAPLAALRASLDVAARPGSRTNTTRAAGMSAIESRAILHTQLAHISWCLSGHAVWPRTADEELFASLERAGIPLSDWQQTLVLAGLRADMNREARWDGRRLFDP